MYTTIKLQTKLRFHSRNLVGYCTKTNGKNISYSHTVLLPKTKFPLRIEGKKLVDRDNHINSSISFTNLYKWQRTALNSEEFILHDGPPYANGETHMGHAINKILKDVIVRTKILEGRKVHFVPGWDCHGLPIELKAVTHSKNIDPIQIREKARKFATDTIEAQKKSFLSWGICGDWENSYMTYNDAYVKNQFRQFYKLYEEKLIYRDVKPVYWSPSTRTALAEAELEYNENHKSTTVYVKFELKNVPGFLRTDKKIFGLIWTTTPWTLPGNQAVCYNPKLSYSLVENVSTSEYYIICTNLVVELSQKFGTELHVISNFNGDSMTGITYIHPIYHEKILNFLPADHPVETKGTGLVHTAPAHGPDDFLVALNNNIQIEVLVNEDGCYEETAGKSLSNKYVLKDGTETVLEIIKNEIVQTHDFIHSYPYDWRTKLPVIIRASKQWFIDTNSIKQRALDALDNVVILPKINSDVHRRHFKTQLLKRPYWCISRQRSWGVPIPIFYNSDNDDIIISKESIEHFCSLVDKHGSNFWWTLNNKEILPETILKQSNLNNMKKGQDILDIWFDSGLSWSSVLPEGKISDVYVEGVDQFTGWFQSSLLTSIALQNCAPYKSIYVHGFAVDENGLKMSKSLGNVIDPRDVLEGCKAHRAYGVDTLRWWVACHANQDSITEVSQNVLQSSKDEVQKIRSTLRFALAALSDYKQEIVDYKHLHLIDKYMLQTLIQYDQQISEYLKDYQFHKIGLTVIPLLTNTISSLYYTAIKDRLYCKAEFSADRAVAQLVLYKLFLIVLRSVAPILPHLAEELYSNLQCKNDDYFFQTMKPTVEINWKLSDVEEAMNFVLEVKKELNKAVGANTINKVLVLYVNDTTRNILSKHIREADELLDIFQVAEIEIKTGRQEPFFLEVKESNLHCCPRCRKFSTNIKESLCKRCETVILHINNRVPDVI